MGTFHDIDKSQNMLQNTILQSLTEDHYIEVHGNVRYGIRLKLAFIPSFRLTFPIL